MTLPNLLSQYQCTTPSCSRMSSPLNVLQLLPTIEEFISNNTTQIPFVIMRLRSTAEQSCPFCGAPSRIIPVDPSFQAVELRTALKAVFGSFFGYSGPDVMDARDVQWVPVQVPGNETSNAGQDTKVQWVIVGDQVHQLLIHASSLARELQRSQPSRSVPTLSPATPGTPSTRSTSSAPTQSNTLLASEPLQGVDTFDIHRRPTLFPRSTFPQMTSQQYQPESVSQVLEPLSLLQSEVYPFAREFSHLEVALSSTTNPTSAHQATTVSSPQTWSDLFRQQRRSADDDNNNDDVTEAGNDNNEPTWLRNWPPDG